MCGSFNHGCDIIHPAVFGIIISILTETPVGSTIVAIDMIAFATASIFGKVIAMWSYEKIYKTHGGNLTDDIYIYRMWKSYDNEENIKKGNRLWSGKDG